MRFTLSLVAGAAVAFVAAVLLGEYAFSGLPVIGAGVVLGLFVSEATTSVARRRSIFLAVAGAVFTVAGLLGAAWISTDQRLSMVGFRRVAGGGAGRGRRRLQGPAASRTIRHPSG